MMQFHPAADEEYQSAIEWYRTHSPRAANRFEAEVERLLKVIAVQPAVFGWYDELHRFAVLRKFPYSIVYQEYEGAVYVVAIAHSSREPGYWQGR